MLELLRLCAADGSRCYAFAAAGKRTVDSDKGEVMATWIWIVIAIAAVAALVVAVLGARRIKERRVVRQRKKAQELRQEAAQRHRRAKEREDMAKELSERAKAERKEADKVGAQAARVDPDRD
jgi:flagellar biosynthesis/type III secretory pathway M-ring protein FliF/YscJ